MKSLHIGQQCHYIWFSPQCHNNVPLSQYNINLRSQLATFFHSLVLLYHNRQVFHAKAEGLLPRSLFLMFQLKSTMLHCNFVSKVNHCQCQKAISNKQTSVTLMAPYTFICHVISSYVTPYQVPNQTQGHFTRDLCLLLKASIVSSAPFHLTQCHPRFLFP